MLSRGTRPATPSVYVVTWRWSAAKVVGFATAVAAAGSCSAGGATGASPADGVLALLRDSPSAGGRRTEGDDPFEVWICHVPADATASIYGGLPLRLPLTPAAVTAVVAASVPAYFDALSHGKYRPVFTAGGEVTIGRDDQPQACVDAAIAGAGPAAEAVLVVADAEHGADQAGGFGTGGQPCPPAAPCAVGSTRRAAYVGASDFHPDWGDRPPMDLVEHEIGHTLGWVHSGTDDAGNYRSGLDVMSNSAAAREADPSRRDAPGTLAVNLYLAGWLPAGDVAVAFGTADVTLAPSLGDEGTRLVVFEGHDGELYSVELFANVGIDDHLLQSGVGVHRIEIVNGSITRIEPVLGDPPEGALMLPGAQIWITNEWSVTVRDGWQVRIVDETRLPI